MSVWDERYKKEEFIFGKEPNDFLRTVYRLIPKGKVLFLGEGEGRNSVFLAKLKYEVVAVDNSSVGREKALKLAEENNVEIEYNLIDLKELKLKNESHTGIVSIFCHVDLELQKEIIRKSIKGLKKGGFFILESYTKNQINKGTGGPSNIDLLLSKEELENEFKGTELIIYQEIERLIYEGTAHSGLSSVIQILAKKI